MSAATVSSDGARRILVVEDDAAITDAIVAALREHGFIATSLHRGRDVVERVVEDQPDLVLLDAGLPDIDGFSICRLLRATYADLPIILVTARDSDIDIVVGLDAGANDYVTKPFSMAVLLARVRAQLRSPMTTVPDGAIDIGEVRVDPRAFTASIAGKPVDLRPREFQLLHYLAREAGRVVTRERLLADLWDLHWDSSTKTIDMHIVALRRKFGSAIEIVTIRGIGYRLVAS